MKQELAQRGEGSGRAELLGAAAANVDLRRRAVFLVIPNCAHVRTIGAVAGCFARWTTPRNAAHANDDNGQSDVAPASRMLTPRRGTPGRHAVLPQVLQVRDQVGEVLVGEIVFQGFGMSEVSERPQDTALL